MPDRMMSLAAWARTACGQPLGPLEVASSDASSRRYFRVRLADGGTRILMDAPPQMERPGAFVYLAQRFADLGIHVPRVYASDLARGFALLEDLGTQHYLDVLDEATVERLYGDALSSLLVLQACGPREGLPAYDRTLLERELGIFTEWLLGRHLGLELEVSEWQMLEQAFEALVQNALEQPQVCVHRDFHSRNLMVGPPPRPGVLDFQDAVIGPVTYDLVSLLRDCYVAWPAERVDAWAWGYFELAVQSGVLRPEHESDFLRWFDLMGVQRHLKAAGIFSRLKHRDNKPGYVADLPRTLSYVVTVAERRPELSGLGVWMRKNILPLALPR